MKTRRKAYDFQFIKPLETIEELLKSRRKNPVLTLKLIKDMAKRIKQLENKLGK